MFTGRIDEIGQIDSVIDERIMVRAPKSAGRVRAGGSLNVAGVRVTAEDLADGSVTATLSAETRRRTTFDSCVPGQRVNVEPALAVGDPLDGHLVQGHVDRVGKVAGADEWGKGRRVWIRPPDRFLPRVAAKGSIAVDGVSLAVAEVVRDRFSVVLIPSTLERTTLAGLAAGDRVNLESDLVARLASARPAAASADVARAIGSLGWAGHISGRRGAEKAVAQLAAGGAVVVWDPAREVEGDVIFAGAAIRPQSFTFLLTQCCGHTTVPCAPEVLERLANPRARPPDFLRPGHVFPLAARAGLLATRGGHTESTVALCAAAGLPPVGVCCEVMNPDGAMAGPADLEAAALRWGLPLVDISDLRTWL